MVSFETVFDLPRVIAHERMLFSAKHYPSCADARLVLHDAPTQTKVERDLVAQYVSHYGLAQVYRLLNNDGDDSFQRALDLTQVLADAHPGEPVALGAFSTERGVEFHFPRGYFGKAGVMPAPKVFVARDGTPLSYREYESNSGQIVLLLHGATTHDGLYAPLARFLAARQLAHVFALTLRGHSASGKAHGDVSYVEQSVDDLADTIQHLRSKHPHTKIFLLGHSLGGGLALRFAASHYTSDVHGYILLAPYLGMSTPRQKKSSGLIRMRVHWKNAAALTLANQFGITRWNHLPLIDFAIPRELITPMETARYSFNLWHAASPSWNVQATLRRMNVPTLVLVGEEDEMLDAHKYARFFPQRRSTTIQLIPRATHLGIVFSANAQRAIQLWMKEQSITI